MIFVGKIVFPAYLDIDKTNIVGRVINAARGCSPHIGIGKVMVATTGNVLTRFLNLS